jgi:Fe-S oxidoreductase
MFLTDPPLTHRVARKRLESLNEIDSGTVITACQNCKSVLAGALQGEDSGIRVFDVVELIAMVL